MPKAYTTFLLKAMHFCKQFELRKSIIELYIYYVLQALCSP